MKTCKWFMYKQKNQIFISVTNPYFSHKTKNELQTHRVFLKLLEWVWLIDFHFQLYQEIIFIKQYYAYFEKKCDLEKRFGPTVCSARREYNTSRFVQTFTLVLSWDCPYVVFINLPMASLLCIYHLRFSTFANLTFPSE